MEHYSFDDEDGGPRSTETEEVDEGVDPHDVDLADVDGTLAEGDDVDIDSDDVEDGEDDNAVYVSALEPAGEPPEGYKFIECPSLEEDEDLLALIGKPVYVAWDAPNILGWYAGQVVARGCSARDLKSNPSANFVVAYDKKATRNRLLHGRVASTLTKSHFGASQWWILMEKV
jgi:hypothetical protein